MTANPLPLARDHLPTEDEIIATAIAHYHSGMMTDRDVAVIYPRSWEAQRMLPDEKPRFITSPHPTPADRVM